MAAVDLHLELSCTVCKDTYSDPATLPCGHSFCRACITLTWEHQDEGEFSCPECKRRYRKRPKLRRNLRLHNIAAAFRHSSADLEETGISCTYCDLPVAAVRSCGQCETSMCGHHLRKHNQSVQHTLMSPTRSVRGRICPDHKKLLEYYCPEDSACVCVSCQVDGKHRGHLLQSLEEAAEKKREKLGKVLERLIVERQQAELKVQNLQKCRKEDQAKAAAATERVAALFEDLRRQLGDLERRIMTEISQWEERVSLSVSGLIRQIELERDQLMRRILSYEELCSIADPLTFLQKQHIEDICDTEREESPTGDRVTLSDIGELKFSEALGKGLSDIMRCAEVAFYIQEPSDITLHLDTAANNLKIVPETKTVLWSQVDHDHPDSTSRFQSSQVISSESFSSGRHYWDVESSSSGGWRIGVCYPSIGRAGDRYVIGENRESWCLRRRCMWRLYSQYLVRHDGHTVSLPQNISGQKFRLFLDYEAGRISFYELSEPIRHLHTFTVTFTEPLHAAFYVWGDWWYKDSWLRVTRSPSGESDWPTSHPIGSSGEESY